MLLLMVTAPRSLLLFTFLPLPLCLYYAYVHLSPHSVPDLSEYRVWLGVSDLRGLAPNSSFRQEVSISHVVCGPEGSNLALIRLAQ